ncbi:MAG: D-cysteine desulfhydrase [Pseudomonadota bacterium]|nr:D-cysteine desulfhydrase [Pseudomonadota bacterium]
MHLARFPRRRYTPAPTPLEPLPRLSEHLGGPEIWIKRDDLLGLAAGGNKTRKLEFLVADALAQGADTLITVGAVQSNHCRLTLAAAAKEGLRCRLLLEERVPGSYDPKGTGNNFLFELLGAEAIRVLPAGADLAQALQAEADAVSAEGRRAYVIPGGGSNPRGALGYAACAEEILGQTFQLGLPLDAIVCTSGSAGTHAGLLVGLTGSDAQIPLSGISVRRPQAEQEALVHGLAGRTSELLGASTAVAREDVVVHDEWVGPGYAIPTDEMVDAVRLLARLEGVLLDPVYTGKTMAGLIGLIGRGAWEKGQRVLFLHTGGSPALYAYQGVLSDGHGRS